MIEFSLVNILEILSDGCVVFGSAMNLSS